MSGHIYYSQQTILDRQMLELNKEELYKVIKYKNINALSQFIEENLTSQIIVNEELQEQTHRYSVAILPVDEYKRLKAIEKKYDRLSGDYNV